MLFKIQSTYLQSCNAEQRNAQNTETKNTENNQDRSFPEGREKDEKWSKKPIAPSSSHSPHTATATATTNANTNTNTNTSKAYSFGVSDARNIPLTDEVRTVHSISQMSLFIRSFIYDFIFVFRLWFLFASVFLFINLIYLILFIIISITIFEHLSYDPTLHSKVFLSFLCITSSFVSMYFNNYNHLFDIFYLVLYSSILGIKGSRSRSCAQGKKYVI